METWTTVFLTKRPPRWQSSFPTARISPAEATAAVGSFVQFHARLDESKEDVAVTWNIIGCNDCGTISATGLYTAPLKLPNPPQVKISATRISNFLPDTVQATVTVVAPEP
jgi:hypothetical protein